MIDPSLPTMAIVGAYVLVTAPLLFLVLRVHGLRSDYNRLFLAALILQLIPVGLVFFPLGFIGVALLVVSMFTTARRNARFRAMGIRNPEVERRWRLAYMLHLWALGFALEQKGVAYLFLDVVSHKGFGFLFSGLLPMSVALWAVLGILLWQASRGLPPLSPADDDGGERA